MPSTNSSSFSALQRAEIAEILVDIRLSVV